MARSSSEPRIAFSVDDDIYTIHPDGSDRINLTKDFSGGAGSPDWSPSGDELVFACTFDLHQANIEVCRMRRDGSELTRLTFTPKRDERFPQWSPSGWRIAVNRDFEIFTMTRDGMNLRRVPHTRNSSYLGWGVNGRLVFTRGSGDGGDIYSIRPDGSGVRRLSRGGLGEEEWPEWSPDGREIVFVRNPAVSHAEVFVMKADGTNVVRLTRNCCSKMAPAFSSDGEFILFLNQGLFRMRHDGSEIEPIPNNMDAGPPDWGPGS